MTKHSDSLSSAVAKRRKMKDLTSPVNRFSLIEVPNYYIFLDLVITCIEWEAIFHLITTH